MNEQAMNLRTIAQMTDPNHRRTPIRWLIHGCTKGLGITTILKNTQTFVNQLGWHVSTSHTPSNTAKDDQLLANVEIQRTDSDVIDPSRLPENVLIIFVVDATPSSLVNTYSQMKELATVRPDLRNHIAILSNQPNSPRTTTLETTSASPSSNSLVANPQIGKPGFSGPHRIDAVWEAGNRRVAENCPARTVIRSCQRFLKWSPHYLGWLPFDPFVGLASCEGHTVIDRWPERHWSMSLMRTVRKCLTLEEVQTQATQESDSLSLQVFASKANPPLTALF